MTACELRASTEQVKVQEQEKDGRRQAPVAGQKVASTLR